ncbi:MAG: transcriptional repressor [Schleiferilactobacillus harbinensis]|jgi:Fur family peroxide stress response transcriptional regulator|nr:transcriptional repressor [Schleiferilactobacillus harbinensis]
MAIEPLSASDLLKKSHTRVTPQREAILSFLMGTDTHPSADAIYQHLSDRFPNMSVATVYNNLRTLTGLGIIQELPYGDNSSRFDYIETAHYHAICQVCGKIFDVYYPGLNEIDTITENATDFKVTAHRIEVYGICPDCQKKSAAGR